MEYRIKATSAEHRKAIIGALEGLGYKWPDSIVAEKGNMGYPFIRVLSFPRMTGSCAQEIPTHTSLDTLIADIIRDRQTVEISVNSVKVRATAEQIRIGETPAYYFTHEHFDRIAEAVKKVRG